MTKKERYFEISNGDIAWGGYDTLEEAKKYALKEIALYKAKVITISEVKYERKDVMILKEAPIYHGPIRNFFRRIIFNISSCCRDRNRIQHPKSRR